MESYVNQMQGRLWLAYDLFREAEQQAMNAALSHSANSYPIRADAALVARNNYHVMANWLVFIVSGRGDTQR